MDVWTTFPALVRLIKAGHHNGQVFESKSTLVTSVGGMTVIATKPKADKVFKDSVPLIRTGYRHISTEEEEPISPGEIVHILLEYADFLEPTMLKQLIAELQSKAEEAKNE